MVFNRACGFTVNPACGEEEDKEACDEGFEKVGIICDRATFACGGFGGRASGFINERRAGSKGHSEPKRNNAQHRESGAAEAFSLRLGEGLILFGIARILSICDPFAKARLDDFIRHKPNQGQVNDQKRENKISITCNIGIISRDENFARFFGNSVKQRVELTRRDIG